MVPRLQWLAYAGLIAVLASLYLTMYSWGVSVGYDFGCFRAAALLLANGGDPYNAAQLWHEENALYNLPGHLRAATAGYYSPNLYYNPLLFATLLTPLARLPFMQGYALYIALLVACAVAGAWLTLRALGWTRLRVPAVVIAILLPTTFLNVWWGQQSTVFLAALGAALLALRRDRVALAGALLAVGWIKLHLLVPVVLVAPLLFARRDALRWLLGFSGATAVGVMASVAVNGPGSIGAWIGDLVGYSGYVDTVHRWLPSLSGMVLVLAPHPWNRPVSLVIMLLGLGIMAGAAVHARRHGLSPVIGLSALVAIWLFVSPYVATNDWVLALPALAVLWTPNGQPPACRIPALTLWVISALTLAFVLPHPFILLGLLPPFLLCTVMVWTLLGTGLNGRQTPEGSTA